MAGEAIPLGSRLIKILNDMADMAAADEETDQLVGRMEARTGWYDVELMRQVAPHFYPPPDKISGAVNGGVSISLRQLQLGDRLLAPVETVEGYTVVAKGNRIGPTLLDTVLMYADLEELKEPLLVERG